MIFHENRLLADHSHEISSYFRKLRKMSKNLLSAAVVIGTLIVNGIFRQGHNLKIVNCRTLCLLL